jgi:hypothetical protein
MHIFIKGTGVIAPYTPGNGTPLPTPTNGPRLRCIEPDYKQLIDPRLIRRMSRVVRMGMASALAALNEAGLEMPGAIITATAYGCTEDTETFLTKLTLQDEQMLTPTAFIQSTHNTIAGQIALLLKCHAYNNTFTHRAFSFEHALLDAMLLLKEGEAAHVLLGAVDEMQDTRFKILERFGLYKKPAGFHALSPLNEQPQGPGTIAGEGAAFFVLTNEATDKGCIMDLRTFFKPDDMAPHIQAFLAENGLKNTDVDLLLWGKNGDVRYDHFYDKAVGGQFGHVPKLAFKQLCGEYPVATSYATWLAAYLLKGQKMPDEALTGSTAAPRHILIYNHYYNIHHSLILLSAC